MTILSALIYVHKCKTKEPEGRKAEHGEAQVGALNARNYDGYLVAKSDTTGLGTRRVAADIPAKPNLMNPMYHLVEKVNDRRSRHWWIRLDTKDSDTSHVISANLAARLDNLGDDVNHLYYRDQGHGANTGPVDFITWIAEVTGHDKGEKGKRN
ncbi:hypothetical protein ACFV2H_41175 [Streptomyces sp. NPDC059629]|uniref:hypothetical protein n=1 Tax=Streptomyces sp. NPDC059629 TaxID=3346889 RepID=UPI0036C13AEE